MQLCDALAAAHAQGIIHRDIKPSNVMVDGRDRVKLLDFGIATAVGGQRLTRTDMIIGSAHAISPECVLESTAASPASDLYSVGALLFELLTGVPPYGREDMDVLLRRKLVEPAPELPPHVPPALAALVRQLMDREPQRRPADAGVVIEHLRGAMAELGTHERSALSSATPSRRRGTARWLGALVAAGALGTTWYLTSTHTPVAVARPPTAPIAPPPAPELPVVQEVSTPAPGPAVVEPPRQAQPTRPSVAPRRKDKTPLIETSPYPQR
jgi:serine/threonine-protein kinase